MALVLLEDNVDATKLVVSWPRVLSSHDYAVISESDLTDEHVERWAALSDVDPERVSYLAAMLFGNEIIGPGSVVAEQARAFVNSRVAARLVRRNTQ